METVEVLIAIASLLLTFLFIRWYRDPLRRIPGPPGLPFLGNAMDLHRRPLQQNLLDWPKKYGPVLKFKIFTVPVVLINTLELTLEAMVKRGSDFAGRPVQPRLEEMELLTSQNDDPIATKTRKVFSLAMKAYGPGVAHLEDQAAAAMSEYLERLKARDGEKIDSDDCILEFVSTSMGSMLFGEKQHVDSSRAHELMKVNESLLDTINPFSWGAFFDAFPSLRHVKFILPATQRALDDWKKISNDFYQQKYDEAKANFKANEIRSMMDHLISMQKSGDKNYDEARIKSTLAAFTIGGINSSIQVANQMILNLLCCPDVAKKIQEQIDQNFSTSESIRYRDREKLPYLQAFLLEALRYGSLAPVLFPRATVRDSELGGYKIPKGTMVAFNGYHLMHNPDVYPDPFKLKPERFLDDEGHMLPLDHPAQKNMVQFGMGRRKCPGELFGKSKAFVFFANLLREFNIEPAEPVPDDNSMTYNLEGSGTLETPAFKIRFVQRKLNLN